MARTHLVEALGEREADVVVQLAGRQDRVEFLWRLKMRRHIEAMLESVLERSKTRGKLDTSGVDFGHFLMLHWYEVTRSGVESTRHTTPVRLTQLAKDPANDVLAWLRRRWDRYRKSGEMTPRQAKIAAGIKAKFLEKIHAAWRANAEGFLTGDVATQEEAVEAIRRDAAVVFSRAKMIVETETTKHFNQARRDVYDQSPDVTHYLFMAIRDHRTTKWCKTRHGLVYEKGDPLLDAETPPCFTGESLVLTDSGWKPIHDVSTADHVWTHRRRWRRVTAVHRKTTGHGHVFQIGSAMATANHAYFERDAGLVEAERFWPSKGLRPGAGRLRRLLQGAVDAVRKARPEILLNVMSHKDSRKDNATGATPEVAWWQESAQARIRGNAAAGSSSLESARLRLGTCGRCGAVYRTVADAGRGRAPHQHGEDRQPSGKSNGHDHLGSCVPACKVRWTLPEAVVWNLEVEDDQSYVCGGHVVHNCHWNCRSEVIPLSPANAFHRKLIENPSIARRNNYPEPLPPGWTGSV